MGHTVGFDKGMGNLIRGGIFSFHMPLFFILSCVTFSFFADEPKFFLKLKKAFRHLIIPVFILYGIRIVLYIINLIISKISRNG